MSTGCLLCEAAPLPESCAGVHEDRAVWFAVGAAIVLTSRRKPIVITLCAAHSRTVGAVLTMMAPDCGIEHRERPS
jgi:hypothetical protein